MSKIDPKEIHLNMLAITIETVSDWINDTMTEHTEKARMEVNKLHSILNVLEKEYRNAATNRNFNRAELSADIKRRVRAEYPSLENISDIPLDV